MNLEKIVYLSEEQKNELFTNGTVTVGGVTVTYSSNDLYITPEADTQSVVHSVTIESGSAWNGLGTPYAQVVEVTGIVAVDASDSTTEVTWSCGTDDGDVLAQYSLLTFTVASDAVNISTSSVINVDVPVTASQNNVNYSFTVSSGDYFTTGAPYMQEISVVGLASTDNAIVDVIPSSIMSDAEAQLEAYGNVYRMIAGTSILTVYSFDKTDVDIPIQVLCVRK